MQTPTRGCHRLRVCSPASHAARLAACPRSARRARAPPPLPPLALCARRRLLPRCPSASAAAAPAPLELPGPVVVIDNYDSFTYNLVQYLYDAGVPASRLTVLRNDEATCAEIAALRPAGILISPGPGAPEESGVCLEACLSLGPRFPLLGVCMGHQCIGQAFGGRVVRVPTGLMHGKASAVSWADDAPGSVLLGMPSPFQAARYHSLCVSRDGLPADLAVTAWVEDGTVMGLRSRRWPWVQGIQFHPESVLTSGGSRITANWAQGLAAAAAEAGRSAAEVAGGAR